MTRIGRVTLAHHPKKKGARRLPKSLALTGRTLENDLAGDLNVATAKETGRHKPTHRTAV